MSLFSACWGSASKTVAFFWYSLVLSVFVLYWFLMAPNCRHYCKNQLSLPLVKRCTLLFCRFPTRQKCSFGSASQLKVFPKIHLIVPFVCEYNALLFSCFSLFFPKNSDSLVITSIALSIALSILMHAS